MRWLFLLLGLYLLYTCSNSSSEPGPAEIAYNVCIRHGSESTECKVANTLILAGAKDEPGNAEFEQLKRLAAH